MKAIISFFAQSSADPSKLSATLTGIIVGVASYIVFIAAHFYGVPVDVQQVTDFATLVGTTGGGIVTIFGIIRKVWYMTLHKFANTPV